MRAPADHPIPAPGFPARLRWIGSRAVRMHELRGHPVLIEFWDFCRPNSMRTLPYLRAWNDRYAPLGLQVIGVHDSGFPPSGDPDAVAAAVERLGIPYPVVVDAEFEIWKLYGIYGWPSRYLFDGEGILFEYHIGEGGYEGTERAIAELLGVEQEPLAPLRPEDAPGALVTEQSQDVAGPYSGPYVAGGVWAVLDGEGTVTANGRVLAVDHPGCYELIAHERSTSGELELAIGDGVECYAVCFTPGLAD